MVGGRAFQNLGISVAKFDWRLISRDVQIDAFKNRRDFYADFNEKTIRAHLT